VSISRDRRHRLIRRWTVTDAARHDGGLLPELIDRDNTAGDVWADTVYRSKANEKFLADRLLRSQIHCRKPMREANATDAISCNAIPSPRSPSNYCGRPKHYVPARVPPLHGRLIPALNGEGQRRYLFRTCSGSTP
jgi:hypothetical protein